MYNQFGGFTPSADSTSFVGYKRYSSPSQTSDFDTESSERRKEKSRDAARCRRSRETEIFTELASLLPLPRSALDQLDKASVMRLVISFLRVRNVLQSVPVMPSIKPDPKYDPMFLEALTGFLLVLSADGDIVFLSENVNEYLGLSQIELVGQSIYDVSHPCDHNEMRDILSVKEPSPERSFFMRLKCTLTSKGKSVNFKSASYKVIHCTGHLVLPLNVKSDTKSDKDNDNSDKSDSPMSCCLIAIGEPIPHPSNIEIPLGSRTFLSKHSLDMKFTYADEKMADFLGYDPDTLLTKSLYEFHHAQDSKTIEKSFKHLLSKGQSQTEQYRFLVNGGGYVWVLTQASLCYNNKGQKQANSVVCVNFIISGVEKKNEIYSACQLLSNGKENEPIPARVERSPEAPKEAAAAAAGAQDAKPRVVTSKLFRPVGSVNAVNVVDVAGLASAGSAEKPKPELLESLFSESEYLFELPEAKFLDEEKVLGELPLPGPAPAPAPARPQTVTSKVLAPYPTTTPEPQTQGDPALCLRPQATTAKIFAPRTEEMNKGFLTFSDDDGLAMLKDEPEDLTHLAPTAGDVCVPLDTPRFLDSMLDDFILSDSYCPLLSEATTDSITKDMSPSDSFFSYRDALSSSRSLSPSLTQSPEDGSIPSLGTDSPPLEDSTINSLLGLDLDSNELSMRAPYIPNNDLPLLLSADLMWGANSTSNTSNSSSSSSLSRNSYNASNNNHNSNMWSPPGSPIPSLSSPDPNSSLARLLRTDSGGGSPLSELLRQRYANKKGDNIKMKFEGVRLPDVAGSKRIGGPPNDGPWGKTNWKRSRTQSPMARPRIIEGGGGGGGGGGGSVLMNLLVSGCDVALKNETEKLSRMKSSIEPEPPNNYLSSMGQTSNLMAVDPKFDNQLNSELMKVLQSAL
nr:PREDICTED: protein similar isoform X1 [Bemisia tabaci]